MRILSSFSDLIGYYECVDLGAAESTLTSLRGLSVIKRSLHGKEKSSEEIGQGGLGFYILKHFKTF